MNKMKMGLRLCHLFVLFILHVADLQEDCTTAMGKSGICVPLKDCVHVKDFLNRTLISGKILQSHTIDMIRKDYCGEVNNDVKVCCKTSVKKKVRIYIPQDDQDQCASAEGSPKVCMDLQECKHMMDLFNKTAATGNLLGSEAIKLLRKEQCGFSSAGVRVCCHNNIEKAPELKPQLPQMPNCGEISPNDNKIFGGIIAGLNEFPWLAYLNYEGRSFTCGGSLISDRYVLTAAHCINKFLKRVSLGEYVLNGDTYCENDVCDVEDPVDIVDIEEVKIHPNYKGLRSADDIALIRLTRPVNITKDNIKPICLPTTNELKEMPKRLKIAGWGSIIRNGPQSTVLRFADLKSVKGITCADIYSKRNFNLTEDFKIICAGIKGAQTCRGDSGGPLMGIRVIKNQVSYVQYGILSLGICDSSNTPSVYTDIRDYMDWIVDTFR